ncbi:glycosyltransferase family protein [Chryseobacterium sp. JJR-5R]|uniref:glycosyltransferase family protein n=1 Tax=Chryseobacterium sp. JJR-5R TaxID=3093923 RepID=UPI002A747AD0|nr:glycosyltransferase family protein [Chryseobacterium sp. JJR-5R]WPO83192.1 glycosyltransferase family protein [Chryseobacterium sp. JJR-5R]
MKILYAFQGTGNGHMARAQEIVPLLKKHASVDTLISGHQSQLKADFNVDFKHRGISLLYNKTGGLSYTKTLTGNRFLEAVKVIREIRLSDYDLVINDYEPLTGWACKLNQHPMTELSHQASMLFKETPKPEKKDPFGELVLKYYVPGTKKIGFHFENYHPQIKKPVIRKKIRNLRPEKRGFYLVYLPSFSDKNIIKIVKEIPVEWKIFSRHSKIQYKENNVEIFPIDEVNYLKYFESCEGILCNAGFETPAEALFMDKKLFVIPIHNQYEQACNACALDKMGIPNSAILDQTEIENWIDSDLCFKVDYPDDIESILLNEVFVL